MVAHMQVKRVSAEALTGVLTDLATLIKRMGDAGSMQLAAALDLPFSQLCTLFILDTMDHAPAVHELAERLGLSVAATGRAVDALVRAGMVARSEDEHDRRIKRVRLAGGGIEVIERLTAAQREPLRMFAERLTDKERTDLYHALAPILARPEFQTHPKKKEGE